ncbi:MAG: hypothetical protein ACC657_10130 [Thiohalomonadales bacterium]
MKNRFKYLLLATTVFLFVMPTTSFSHSDKNKTKSNNAQKYKRTVKKKQSDTLVILNIMPKSGKAREAGFDGKFIMESTSIQDSDFTLCAKATRGLIMLDNAMLKKCGGRPSGWSQKPAKVPK